MREIPESLDDFAPTSADARWMDATLREHARLGSEDDEELILRIVNEISRPEELEAPESFTILTSESQKLQRGSEGMSRKSTIFATPWLVAAAVIALSLTLLMTLKTGYLPGQRQTDDLRFVVQVIPVASDQPNFEANLGKSLKNQSASGISSSILLPDITTTSLAKLRLPDTRIEDFRITANRSRTTSDGLIYEGDVLVEHGGFRIEAASVRLLARGSGAVTRDATLMARRVRVARTTPDCTVEADSLQIDPASGKIILAGVSRAQTEQGELTDFAAGDLVVLTDRAFAVERSSGGSSDFAPGPMR